MNVVDSQNTMHKTTYGNKYNQLNFKNSSTIRKKIHIKIIKNNQIKETI